MRTRRVEPGLVIDFAADGRGSFFTHRLLKPHDVRPHDLSSFTLVNHTHVLGTRIQP